MLIVSAPDDKPTPLLIVGLAMRSHLIPLTLFIFTSAMPHISLRTRVYLLALAAGLSIAAPACRSSRTTRGRQQPKGAPMPCPLKDC